MSVETMQELLIDELKDLYSAEKQIVKAARRRSDRCLAACRTL
jgi:ferritin-like metal-binding protein YciE